MKWSLQQLYRYNQTNPLEFSETIDYSEYVENYGEIISMDNVYYSGKCYYMNDRYYFTLHIETNMYLEESRTLEVVKFPVNLDVNEIFTTDSKYASDDERIIEKNTIDLYDIVWENIILEKPIKVIKNSKGVE